MLNQQTTFFNFRHRRRRRVAGGTCPLKFGKKISGNFYVKYGQFSGKNHVKLGNFVNFSGKYNKNSGIVIFFSGKKHVTKIRAFC